MSVCLPVSLHVSLSICLYVCLTVCLSDSLPTCLSVIGYGRICAAEYLSGLHGGDNTSVCLLSFVLNLLQVEFGEFIAYEDYCCQDERRQLCKKRLLQRPTNVSYHQ